MSIFAKNINSSIDWAVFKHNENNCRLEFYYSLPDNSLNYISNNYKYQANAELRIVFKDNNSIVKDTSWQISNIIDLVNDIGTIDFLGTKSFILPYGNYQINFIIKDLNDANSVFNKNLAIKIDKFNSDAVEISDLQIANSIENCSSIDSKNEFYKNNLIVLPNPSNEVSGNEPAIKTYFEIYNAKNIDNNKLTIKYTLLDATKREIMNYSRERNVDSDLMVETIKYPVDIVPSGVFFFTAKVVYSINDKPDSISISKKIYIINKNVGLKQVAVFTEDELFEKSEFASMIDNRVDLEIRMARKIALGEEIAAMDRLGTTKAKQRFLYKFWKSRDIDTVEGINLRLENFRKAVNFANMHFVQGSKEGWDTERGEIVLLYGIPETRDIHEAVGSINRFEEWHFNTIEGGVYFFFVDVSAHSGFILVHSTHPKHIYNPDWYKQYVDKLGSTESKYQNNQFNTRQRR